MHFITTCLGNYKTTCFTCRQANPSKVLGPNYNRITIAMRVSGLSPSRFEIVPELVSCSQAEKDMPVHQIITKYIQPDDMQSKTKPIPEKFQLEDYFSLGTVAFQQHTCCFLLLLDIFPVTPTPTPVWSWYLARSTSEKLAKRAWQVYESIEVRKMEHPLFNPWSIKRRSIRIHLMDCHTKLFFFVFCSTPDLKSHSFLGDIPTVFSKQHPGPKGQHSRCCGSSFSC